MCFEGHCKANIIIIIIIIQSTQEGMLFVTTADGVWQTRGITQRISPSASETLILVHSSFGSISARREGKE